MKLRLFLAALAALCLAAVTATPAQAATYGWSWQQPTVYVYDGTTPGGDFAVAEAAAEWSASGINLVMTSDPAAADITVREEYVCGGGLQCYAGTASWSVEGGIASSCSVTVNPGLVDDGKLAQHALLHELGHCIGLAHNVKDIRRSVMNVSVNATTAVDRPSSRDLREAKSLYR